MIRPGQPGMREGFSHPEKPGVNSVMKAGTCIIQSYGRSRTNIPIFFRVLSTDGKPPMYIVSILVINNYLDSIVF
jgi:hypothetical protein